MTKSKQNKSKQNRNRKRYNRKSKHTKNNPKHLTKKQNTRRNNNRRQQAGGADCNIATIKEPAFNIPSLGDIPGLNIGESKAVIYNPNCKTDSYHPMM